MRAWHSVFEWRQRCHCTIATAVFTSFPYGCFGSSLNQDLESYLQESTRGLVSKILSEKTDERCAS